MKFSPYVTDLLRQKSGKDFRQSADCEYLAPVTLSADKVSLYDLLQMVCNGSGLEMLVEEPDRVILFSSGTTQTENGKKNGSTKKKQ